MQGEGLLRLSAGCVEHSAVVLAEPVPAVVSLRVGKGPGIPVLLLMSMVDCDKGVCCEVGLPAALLLPVCGGESCGPSGSFCCSSLSNCRRSLSNAWRKPGWGRFS